MEQEESKVTQVVREAVVKAAEKGEDVKKKWVKLPERRLRRH